MAPAWSLWRLGALTFLQPIWPSNHCPGVIFTAGPLVAPSPRPACDLPLLPGLFPALSSPFHSSFLHARSGRFLSSLGPRPPRPQNHHLGHQTPADPPEQHPAPPHASQNLHSTLAACRSLSPGHAHRALGFSNPTLRLLVPSASPAPPLLLLLSRFSRVRLCDPRDGSPPGSSVHRVL